MCCTVWKIITFEVEAETGYPQRNITACSIVRDLELARARDEHVVWRYGVYINGVVAFFAPVIEGIDL